MQQPIVLVTNCGVLIHVSARLISPLGMVAISNVMRAVAMVKSGRGVNALALVAIQYGIVLHRDEKMWFGIFRREENIGDKQWKTIIFSSESNTFCIFQVLHQAVFRVMSIIQCYQSGTHPLKSANLVQHPIPISIIMNLSGIHSQSREN